MKLAVQQAFSVAANAMPQRVHLCKIYWLMPRMACAVPSIGYIAILRYKALLTEGM